MKFFLKELIDILYVKEFVLKKNLGEIRSLWLKIIKFISKRSIFEWD